MAEGGGEDNDQNPFSFKKFVESSSVKSDTDESADEKIDEVSKSELPDISNDGLKTKKQTDENPFSFKKFLQTNPNTSGARPKSAANASILSKLDLANDLPDFVQDHFSGDSSRTLSRNIPTDVPLPDFALDSNGSVRGSSGSGFSDISPRVLNGDNDHLLPHRTHMHLDPFNVASSDRDNPSEDLPPICANSTGRLPDFLSDSAINSVGCRNTPDDLRVNVSDGSSDDDTSDADIKLELRRLRSENHGLREQLDEARQFAHRESTRVNDVVREMEIIQKREAEENSALENMILQVEANLEATTKRAVDAENTVLRLKAETKALQGQNNALQLENSALRGGAGGQDPVREKALNASKQLIAAANSAEQTLKQLLSGVETIKMVGEVLSSIDKVTEPVFVEEDGGAAGGGDS